MPIETQELNNLLIKAAFYAWFVTYPQHPPVEHWLVAVQDPPIAQFVPAVQFEMVIVGKNEE